MNMSIQKYYSFILKRIAILFVLVLSISIFVFWRTYLTSVSILPDKDPLCRLYEAARCGVIHLIRIYAESDCATRGEAAKARGLRC